ncbi:hypothetical protein LWF15_03335 [Kineosporia rhizophila]|uniref:hypothetical protein n=1 Tax=Kineosporia TaxID=49184 RepID=UPI000A99181B|nr:MULTISPECIES: hypothetical protein [Kineosporia]MCE0534530.1 hypothetical protein [Kineosporia rhizophila]GLY14068.1 hypothetical protein Kisp01_10840 [Kineosporia sp. NBRC 101677]
MSETPRPSFGRRVYMALFQIMGPADVRPVGQPAAHNPDDPTVPQGYHLETFTQPDGIKKRIMVKDS